jgi:hypothetical protein
MAEISRHENSEKRFNEMIEKELQKHNERIEQRDVLSSVIWAVILVWAGLVFLAANSGWLKQFLNGDILTRYLPPGWSFFEPGVWSLVLLGAGAVLLGEAAIRLAVPDYRRHVGGTLITATIFIGIGLIYLFGWDLVWLFILIAAGISLLLGNYLRRL